MGSLNYSFFQSRALAFLLIFSSITVVRALDIPVPPVVVDTNVPAPVVQPPKPVENAVEAQQALRAYLHLQEQLHQTLLTIEQNRKDGEAANQQNAEMLASRLKLIEQALTRQRENEVETARSSSKFALMVAAALGGVGLLVMLFTAWFLMRTARQFSELTAFTTQPALGHNGAAGLLPDPGLRANGGGGEASGGRLLGAIERLEKRMHDI